MLYLNPTDRAALISGLRELADYLESTPGIPVCPPTVYAFPADADWPTMCAEVNAIAALLGAVPYKTRGGQYVAARSFGPLEYKAVAIPPKSNDESE